MKFRAKSGRSQQIIILGLIAILTMKSSALAAFQVVAEASPTSGIAPLNVSFSASAEDSAITYHWVFGDGAESTAQNPTHVFPVAGTFNVKVTAKGIDGTESQSSLEIVVNGSEKGPVTENMSFRWAIRESVFKLNFKQEQADSLTIDSSFSTADLPGQLQGLALAFKVNDQVLIAGILDSFGIIQNSDGSKPSLFLELYPKEQTLRIYITKARLNKIFEPSGATDQTTPSTGNLVPVKFTLVVGQFSYSLTEDFNYVARAGKTGKGKFYLHKDIGVVNQGMFVITRGSAKETNGGESHRLEFDGILAMPSGKILQHPGAGVYQFRFSESDPETILFDRIIEKGNKITFEQLSRDLGGIQRFTIDKKKRTFSIETWDIERDKLNGGTNIPVHGAPFLNYIFEMRIDFDQPNAQALRGIAATLLSRTSVDDGTWRSGEKE